MAPSASERLHRWTLRDGRTVEIDAFIGSGSKSTVYSGWLTDQNDFQRRVAVKVFAPMALDAESVGKLTAAYRRSALISHPNVAEVLTIDDGSRGQYCAIGELVSGCSLAQLASAYARSRRRVPTDLALFIAIEIAEGLLGARHVHVPGGHGVGLLHNDLSPRQVLLSWNGEVKVGDFGISEALPAGSGIRERGPIAEGLRHLAPEIVSGERGDPRSDVFALGVIMHELLRGSRFPDDADDDEVLRLACDGAVHIRVNDPLLPAEIGRILLRAVQVDRRDRYPHAGVLAYDLRRAAMDMGVGDGRAYLRKAMSDMSEALFSTDGDTDVGPRLDESGELPKASYR